MSCGRWSSGLLVSVACVLWACGGSGGGKGPESSDPTPSGNNDDAGTPFDAGTVDSGTPADGGTGDAGTPDGGEDPADGGAPDGGSGPTTACAPTAGGPYWVLEGEAVQATVHCGTDLTADVHFEVDGLPPGATFDAASATLRWTTGKNQAAVWNLTVRETRTGESGTLKVGVAENENAPGNVPIQDPSKYTEEYGLPVVHLFFDPQVGLTAGEYRPVQITYRGRKYDLEAKYRGATSSVFPKRSLTLKFPDEDLFSEPVFGDGFKDRKRVVLITTFNDNSYLRARLAFDVWSRMDPGHIRIRTYSAVLYVNNAYKGLYTVADHVDKRLMAAHGLSKDSDLFKAVDDRANFSRLRPGGAAKASLDEGLEKDEGTPEQDEPHAFDTMSDFIGFVSDSDAATFRQGFATRADARDYEDWWIFNTLILGTDSHSKNAYHAYDTKTGGPWRFIPWDLDASFGQNYDTTRSSPTNRTSFSGNNLIYSRLLADPALAGPMRERYRTLLRGALKKEAVLALIDGYVRETAPSAKRDWAKWWDEYQGFGAPGTIGEGNFPDWNDRQDFIDYEQEVEYVRQWVDTRWDAFESGGVP